VFAFPCGWWPLSGAFMADSITDATCLTKIFLVAFGGLSDAGCPKSHKILYHNSLDIYSFWQTAVKDGAPGTILGKPMMMSPYVPEIAAGTRKKDKV